MVINLQNHYNIRAIHRCVILATVDKKLAIRVLVPGIVLGATRERRFDIQIAPKMPMLALKDPLDVATPIRGAIGRTR
jgi:hypothetical protein